MPEIVVLTGAGISAESGVDTFRDEGGLWSRVRLEDVATPEGYARDPERVLAFYNARRQGLARVAPNPAHRALARLEAALGDEFLLVTQNVDDLHERGGSRRLIHMHGELRKALCSHCGSDTLCDDDLTLETACTACSRAGGMRPAVVWFGEMPMEMERIYTELATARLFVSIGTSGQVYPAAGFVAEAAAAGADTLELNLERTSRAFRSSRLGKAGEIVPAWVEETLQARGLA
jgi:NAD-dependent deacetylase